MAATVGEAHEAVQLAVQRAQHAAMQLAQLNGLLGAISPALEPIFEDHRKLSIANIGLENRVGETTAALDAVQRRAREAEAVVAQLTEDIGDLRARLDLAEERRSTAEAERQLAQSEIRTHESAVSDMRLRLTATATQLAQLQEDKDAVEAELRAAGSECATLRQSLAIEADRRGMVEADLDSLRDRMRELETALDRAQAEAALASQQVQSRQGEMQRLLADLETATADRQRLATELAEAIEARDREQRTGRTMLESARVRAESLDAMNIDLRRQLGEKGEALQERDRQLREQQLRLSRLDSGLREAIEQRQALHASNTDLETSRMALLQRLEDIGKLLRQKEVALRRVEEQSAERQALSCGREAELVARIEALEAERSKAMQQSGQERQELAIFEGRLEAQREEVRRLRAQLLTFGWTDRDGGASQSASDAALPPGGRVRHIMDRETLRS